MSDTLLQHFLGQVERRETTVGIIGMGYVGLPLALVFHDAGFPVIGFDVDSKKIDALHRGETYIRHIGPEKVAAAFGTGATKGGRAIQGTTDFARLSECDAILICVPTPLGEHRDPDLTYVTGTAGTIAKHLRKGQLIVLESTTNPGTTREELLSRFEGELKCGQDFFLAFTPEREDPGNRHFSTKFIPKVVGGVDEASTEAAAALYGTALDTVVRVSSAEVAESSKLLENIFRAINIALVNELKMVFDRMGIDVWEVIEAAKTKPFGYMPFYPGPGLGGHCIPLDPFYLSWKASESGSWARCIELAGEINAFMPRWVVQKVQEALNDDAKALKGAKILVLGLSYKADIDDDRESPSFEIIELLQEKGSQVDYCDPHIPHARKGRKHDLNLASVACDAETFARYDAVLLLTAHEAFADPGLYGDVRLLVDTRNVVPETALKRGRRVGA